LKKDFDREKKKREIAFAALQVFAEKGFSSATIKDIAEKASIGKGTVYEYFKSKRDIIFSAFSLFLKGSEYSIEAIKNLPYPPDQKLSEGLSLFIEAVKKEEKSTFEILFDFWAMGIKEKKYRSEFYKLTKDSYSKYRETFSNIIKDGQRKGIFKNEFSPEIVGAMIIGMLDGLMVQWILDEESVDYIEAVKTMKDIIILALKTQGGKDED